MSKFHITIGGVSWCRLKIRKPERWYTEAYTKNIPMQCGHDYPESAQQMADFLKKEGFMDVLIVPNSCDQMSQPSVTASPILSHRAVLKPEPPVEPKSWEYRAADQLVKIKNRAQKTVVKD